MSIPLGSARGMLLVVLGWLALAGMAVVELWPAHPGSLVGWVVFLLVAPPLFLLVMAVAERASHTRLARFVSSHPSAWVRIGLGVVVGGLFLAAVTIAWNVLARWAGAPVT